MLERTPQEWADFLGTKVVCFAESSDSYAYYAIELYELPFTYKWKEHLNEIKASNSPEEFFKKNYWDMTSTLAAQKYNSIFVPVDKGDIKMLRTEVDGTHDFVFGRIKSIDDAYRLPIDTQKWDKTVYTPVWYGVLDATEETDETTK